MLVISRYPPNLLFMGTYLLGVLVLLLRMVVISLVSVPRSISSILFVTFLYKSFLLQNHVTQHPSVTHLQLPYAVTLFNQFAFGPCGFYELRKNIVARHE
jgi:hypothetical protein